MEVNHPVYFDVWTIQPIYVYELLHSRFDGFSSGYSRE